MAPDASAQLVERLLEPLAGDELAQAVPLGLELADPLPEPLGVLPGRLGLARELRGHVGERLAVLLELRAGRGEVGLELRDDARLAAPAGASRRGRRRDRAPGLARVLGPAGDDRERADERGEADAGRVEHA